MIDDFDVVLLLENLYIIYVHILFLILQLDKQYIYIYIYIKEKLIVYNCYISTNS
jgi:hypothetical protein